MKTRATILTGMCLGLVVASGWSPPPPNRSHGVLLEVTIPLTLQNVPMDPWIDFASLLRDADRSGVLDPNTIAVVDAETGETVPHALSEDFAYGDAGRVQWVIRNPTHRTYRINYDTADIRPPLEPPPFTPLIGMGDLLRYNAGVPRPIAPIYLSRLVDLTGDGKRDLVGCWNYAYRPGWPWSGVVCFPRVGTIDDFHFGNMVHLRYVEGPGGTELKHFEGIYANVELTDLNDDGLVDLVFSPQGQADRLRFYLNSGRRDGGRMPVFVANGSLPRQTTTWGPCRAVDFDGNGTVDFVVGNTLLRNTNPKGWPPTLAEAVNLDAGHESCFLDVDGDGALDAVCLVPAETEDPFRWREHLGRIPASTSAASRRAFQVAWRKNLGSSPPEFGPPKVLREIDNWFVTGVAAVTDQPKHGLLVLHEGRQGVTFYEQLDGTPRFRRFGRAQSISAVVALDDQAWPWICDWNGDGKHDLLVGGGYGWPRVLLNDGTNQRPAFRGPQFILSEDQPIRILRDEVLDSRHWHNMGYPFPSFVDWDSDNLPDLMLPNETNRIFWYKNLGTRSEPRFGKRLQVLCDGYPDSPEKRATTAKLAGDANVPNQPYPYEEDQPFFWRTGAAFSDFNGDGLTDLVTHDGHTRKATLFVQYRDSEGSLRLKKNGTLRLADGRTIDDSIVGRSQHWTESFRATDWNGDGLLDLIYTCAGSQIPKAEGSIYLLLNCGTTSEPLFENPVTLRCFGEPIKVTNHGPHPWVGDFDSDRKPDLLTCVEWSVYPFFSHAALQMKERPKFTLSPVENR